MKKQTGNKNSGNEQIRVTTSIDRGKTDIDIRVYAPENNASRATRKRVTTPETGKTTS